ncbi:hypothetical protein K3495_g184 [Podosphaera aphanis]|nr:hypothetical protein K3495_g184 [Podosphaera aphanis]
MKLSLKLFLLSLNLISLAIPAQANPQTLDPSSQPAPVLSPKCAQSCYAENLSSSLCSTSNPAPCFCANLTLQEQFGKCIFFTCSFPDQIVTTKDFNHFCKEYPKQTRSGQIAFTAIIMSGITLVFVALRIISRWLHQKQLWADDWIAIIVFLLIVIAAVVQVSMANAGMGDHYWNARFENYEPVTKMLLILQILYNFTVSATKVSILVFYHRVFVDEKFQTLCKWSFGFLVLPCVVFFCLILFQCNPISKVWNPTLPGSCLNLDVMILWGAVVSIVQDLVILIMPIPLLSTLNIGRFQTLNLVALFGCASFACVTSVLRLKFAIKMVRHDYDKGWDLAIIIVWSVIEVDVMLICACLPAIRPLLVRCLQASSNLTQGRPGSQKPKIHNENRLWPLQEPEDIFLGTITHGYLHEVKDRTFLDDYTESSGNSYQTPARRPSDGYVESGDGFNFNDDWLPGGHGSSRLPGTLSSDQRFFAKYMQRVPKT